MDGTKRKGGGELPPPLAVSGEGAELLRRASAGKTADDRIGLEKAPGVVIAENANQDFVDAFVEAIAQHRYWDRADKGAVPA